MGKEKMCFKVDKMFLRANPGGATWAQTIASLCFYLGVYVWAFAGLMVIYLSIALGIDTGPIPLELRIVVFVMCVFIFCGSPAVMYYHSNRRRRVDPVPPAAVVLRDPLTVPAVGLPI